MDELILDPRMIRMPEFAPGTWLNTAQPLAKETLRGQVTLIDFWDYTCINCIRTLPYVTAWHERYGDQGLTVIGIHAPEFNFAQHRTQIEAAIERYELHYPVLLDNQYENWYRFAVKAWPTKLLIDADGYIRYVRQGEGYYRETERAIQLLLRERDPQIVLPPLMDPIREEDSSGAVCYRPTQELYAGSERGSLGNRQGYADHPVVYEMPIKHERREPRFYADGIWLAHPESFAFAGQEAGRIMLPYHAATVNAVLSPSSDPVEVMLNLKPGNNILPMVEIRQDGRSLMPDNAGTDIEYDDGGVSYINVGQPRLYEVVRNADFEQHEIEMIFRANGLSVYSFTFTSCVVPGSRASGGDAPAGTYRVG